MTSPSSIHLLDCTFRDGGYYTNWLFPTGCLDLYLASMRELGVRKLEIGYRHRTDLGGFLGPHAFTTEAFLRKQEELSDFELAVMIDARDFLEIETELRLVPDRFVPAAQSAATIVRIATTVEHVKQTVLVANQLIALGYEVIVNLMQAPALGSDVLAEAANALSDASVTAVYLADSLGELDPVSTAELIGSFRAVCNSPVGFHAHNNKSLAIANTLSAIDAGATYVDATIMGMGRGAGNAQTEILACELGLISDARPPESLITLLADYFEPMRRRYAWGPNLLFAYSASRGIHPTFVSSMITDLAFSYERAFDTLQRIARQGPSRSFSQARLTASAEERQDSSENCAQPKGSAGNNAGLGWAQVRVSETVVLMANSGATEGFGQDILDFSARHHAQIYTLNMPHKDLAADISGAFYVDSVRFASDFQQLHDIGIERVFCAQELAWGELERPASDERVARPALFPIAYELEADCISLQLEHLVLPEKLSLALALGALSMMGAKRFYLAGFEGYELADDRKRQVEDVFSAFLGVQPEARCYAITPSSYRIEQRSCFGTYED